MGREAVTGGVHAVSVLACGSALAGVFTHLSKNVEGRGWGSVKNDHTRGVCHIVWRWHLRRPTGPYSGQPVTPPVLPLREKGLHGFSQSHQSLCMSSSRFLTPLDSPLTELACLKALFVQFMQPEVDFLFLWWNLSTPHSSHSPTMSQLNKGAISVAHSASGIKEWKTFFSLNMSGPIF